MPLIVFESEDFLIADKPHGIPTVPLKGQKPEGTLLGMVSERYPEVADVCGRNPWEGGTCHRLDTATAGLVVFARTQAFYDYLQEIQQADLFVKTYRAETIENDFLKGSDIKIEDNREFRIMSYFRAYGKGSKAVRPVQDIRRADSPVLYTTTAIKDGASFTCTITRGFRHQIRAHLAWIGHPIMGDCLYGTGSGTDTLELDCLKVQFPLPDGKPFFFAKN
ncbi:MAG: RNA pseudouridine synthase [Spirochaetales bacterium]|nr:RNA pseudouridine synthase [Spirochaetales bacterium]